MGKVIRIRVFFVMLLFASQIVSSSENLEWPVYGGDALHQRHSLATQITTSNLDRLAPSWEYDTGISATFQATPIVQNGVMYVSLPFNDVVALDAESGQEIWRYKHDRNLAYKMCCGPANRGVAVSDGMVFMGTVDARLIALDAKTGEKRWDIDVVKGEFGIQEDMSSLDGQLDGNVSGTSGAGLNMAPIVYKGKVILGVTGVGYGLHLESSDSDVLGAVVGIAGKYGRRGFLAAFDVNSGKRIWKFDTIPSVGWEGDFVNETLGGVKLPRDIAVEKASLELYADAWRYGGGSAWSTPVIDSETELLYFGTGNPSPQMEGSSRPGDNLFSSSLVALDANTGKRRWHYQQVPHDLWGYDVASPPVLFTARHNGKDIAAVGQAGKTGWFYVHNRVTGELLFKSEAFVPQHNMFATASKEGTIIYPGVIGGSNWSPVSVDENRRRVFVAGIHWPVKYTSHERLSEMDKPALKYSSMSPIDDGEQYGLLSAINIDTGKIIWQHKTVKPLVGGVLSTKSGLVVSGAGDGSLFILDAKTGKKLWSGSTDAGVNAPPVSYQINGKQYFAVAVGGNKLFGFKSGQIIKTWALSLD